MNQQQNLPSDGVELFKETTSVSLAERLQMLDEVDRKVVEIVESIRDLINNLDKEKQVSTLLRRVICGLDFSNEDG